MLDKKVVNLDEILSQSNLLPKFLIKLFSLDNDFFDQYLEVKKDYYSSAKVIDMAAFRN